MRFDGPRFVRARAQGLPAVISAAATATAFGRFFGDEFIGIPGLVAPIPAVRVFPALVAAIGCLVLLEPWKEFELTGAWPVWRHRSYRFGFGLVIVMASGSVLSAKAGAITVVVLAVLFYAVLAVAIGLIGRQWWVPVALGLYAQLFVQEYEEFKPGIGWAALAVLAALPCYLARGERSPT